MEIGEHFVGGLLQISSGSQWSSPGVYCAGFVTIRPSGPAKLTIQSNDSFPGDAHPYSFTLHAAPPHLFDGAPRVRAGKPEAREPGAR